MAETASRPALQNALSQYASEDRAEVARIFLDALSLDELHYLAEFLGSCILITSTTNIGTWDAVGQRARAVHQRERDAHQLLVLGEFAACCGFRIKIRP